MDKKLIETMNKHVKEFMGATSKQLSNIQENPVGYEPRSQKDFGIILSELQKMPVEDRQARLQEVASIEGHKGNQFDDCGLCKFLKGSMKG